MENQVNQIPPSEAPQQAQQPPLTPEAALQNLVFAARQARLTYQEHGVIDNCIQVLAKLVPEQGRFQ